MTNMTNFKNQKNYYQMAKRRTNLLDDKETYK